MWINLESLKKMWVAMIKYIIWMNENVIITFFCTFGICMCPLKVIMLKQDYSFEGGD